MKNKFADKVYGNFFLRNIVVLILILFPLIFQQVAIGNYNTNVILQELFVNTCFLALCIIHNRYLYDHLIQSKKYGSYVFFLIICLILFQSTVVLYERYMMQRPFPDHSVMTWLSIFIMDIFYMALGFGIYFSYKHFKTKHDELSLKYLARTVELQQLQLQLSPHFLFNALNNIYSYSIDSNNKSSELILKLSELMRMVLENSRKEKILLQSEIDFASCYIAFEKERVGKRCTINFSHQVYSESAEIAPFILFTFIENAFKHGTDTIKDSKIDIAITSDEKQITLVVRNTLTKNHSIDSTKMGLSNVIRRLGLIYPNKHRIDFTITEGYYEVYLNFDL